MANQPGHQAYLSVDATAVTSYTDSMTLDRSRGNHETTVFGVTDRTYIAGLREHSFSSSGPWDPTGDGVFDGTDDGSTVAVVFGPEGNDGGDVQYTSNAFVESYSITASVDGRVDYSFSAKPSGAVTRGTV